MGNNVKSIEIITLYGKIVIVVTVTIRSISLGTPYGLINVIVVLIKIFKRIGADNYEKME